MLRINVENGLTAAIYDKRLPD